MTTEIQHLSITLPQSIRYYGKSSQVMSSPYV